MILGAELTLSTCGRWNGSIPSTSPSISVKARSTILSSWRILPGH
ncbi:Uncharacterised protein [Vibrio cholerae]|nr:Uncharacterised protein [Vibrio cholerae]